MFKRSPIWLAIACALLLTWGCLDLSPLPLKAGSPAAFEPSYLVIISYEDWDDLQRLAAMDLNLLDWQAGRLAGLVTHQALAALQNQGFQVHGLDGPTAFDSSYYLVAWRFDEEKPDLDRYGQVFPYTENTFLLKAEPAQVEGLVATGFFIQKLMGPLVLPDQPPSVEIDNTPSRIQSYQPLIQNLVDSVSQTQIYTTILHLQDDDTLPAWDAQGSRYYRSGKMVNERANVRAKFRVAERITHDYGWKNSEGKPIAGPVTIVMLPVGDDGIPEHQRYHKATRAGRLEMQVDNPAVADAFAPGTYHYLDFTPHALSTAAPAGS